MSETNDSRPLRSRLKAGVKNLLVRSWDSMMYRGPIWRFACSRVPEPREEYEEVKLEVNPEELCGQAARAGIAVKDLSIDVDDYREYLKRARYHLYPDYVKKGTVPGEGFAEKSLEHYLSFVLLGLSADDVYVDIASSSSPVPDIVRRVYGATAYRQDLFYREGLHGNTIGGDAGDMPVEDGFATMMALHCSFEHFEGDADSRFIRESERVLAPGGKVCILPLYLHHRFVNLTDPTVLFWMGRPEFDRGVPVIMLKKWHSRFARSYDVPRLIERVVNHLGDQSLELYQVTNAKEIHPGCYLRFAAVITRLQ